MKKPNYAEARREIIKSGAMIGPGASYRFVGVDSLRVAAEALERLNKQPAMKDQERIFFALCYNLRNTHKPRAVVNMLCETIPHKRCWYYLEKWHRLGFYSSGVTDDLGWFYPEKLPERYREIVQQGAAAPAGAALDVGAIMRDTTDAHMLLAAAQQALREMVNAQPKKLELRPLPLFMDDRTESGLLEDD